MKGSQRALQYAERDFETVRKAMPFVKGRTACVQAGACLGVYPQYLANYFSAVYAFEPDPVLFRTAVQNATHGNIVWFNSALGSRRGLVGTKCERRDGSDKPVHEGLTFTVPGGKIPTLRIDDLGLGVCDLICLDIEGAELYALQGARNTIQTCKPVIIIEVNKQCRAAGLIEDDLRTHVRMHGYEERFRNNSDEVYTPCQ